MFLRILSISVLALYVGAQNDNAAYNNVDYSFLSKFSLKFQGCYNVPQFFPYQQGQNNKNQNNQNNNNGNNNNNNNNNNKRLLGGGGGNNNPQNRAGLYSQAVVSYKLCSGNAATLKPTCSGPQYVTDLGSFVNAYTEAKMTQDAFYCEEQREKADSDGDCLVDGVSDVTCEQEYFNKTGNSKCIQTDLEANFNVQRYLYCQKYNAYNGYVGFHRRINH